MTLLISGGSDRALSLWELNRPFITEFVGHRGGVTAGALEPDGNILATVAEDSTLRLWRRDSPQVPLVVPLPHPA